MYLLSFAGVNNMGEVTIADLWFFGIESKKK